MIRKNTRSGIRKLFYPLIIASLFISANASALLIDNFNSGSDVLTSSDPGPRNTASGDAIGGSRTVEVLTLAPIPSTSVTVDAGAAPNVYSQNQTTNTSGSSELTWDANTAGLGGVDLTQGGTQGALKFDLVSIDVNSVDATFTLFDGANTVTSMLTAAAVGTYFFSYASFLPLVPAFDFTSVDSIMLTLVGGLDTDFAIDNVQTVPVPGALLLFGSALIGMFGVSRKRTGATA